jgi:hypothetical protein
MDMAISSEPPDTMSDQSTQSLEDRLAGIAAFLPIFTDEKFRFGEFVEPKRESDGCFTMGYFKASAEAKRFTRALRELGWVQPFDWPAWKQTPEACQLRDDPEALASADAEQLSRLLTVLVRQERFADGTLLDAFESGLITRILKRAQGLLDEKSD